MAIKLVNATELRSGGFVILDDTPCIVRSIDISKTGKHGHAKARIAAMGIIDGKKHIKVMPGSERVQVPIIEKRKAQVLNINKEEKKVSVMDLESFETLDVSIDPNLIEDIEESMQIEYWNVEGKKIIKRKA
ncbi:MAG: translation initiation factor IF-5A [Candidatus Pacearchaeota archaeon]|nr:MAG: translation initiation factor IF-5A [Candidatus Pacearchaeota archaeon]